MEIFFSKIGLDGISKEKVGNFLGFLAHMGPKRKQSRGLKNEVCHIEGPEKVLFSIEVHMFRNLCNF